MKIKNWVVFIVLTFLVFTAVLVTTYSSEIVETIKLFPLDIVVSYVFGAACMFIATRNWFKKKTKKEMDHEEITAKTPTSSTKSKNFKDYDISL